jgi:hypothetical protein
MEIPTSALEQTKADVLMAMLTLGFVMMSMRKTSVSRVHAGRHLIQARRQHFSSTPRTARINDVLLRPIVSSFETHKPCRAGPTHLRTYIPINRRSCRCAISFLHSWNTLSPSRKSVHAPGALVACSLSRSTRCVRYNIPDTRPARLVARLPCKWERDSTPFVSRPVRAAKKDERMQILPCDRLDD